MQLRLIHYCIAHPHNREREKKKITLSNGELRSREKKNRSYRRHILRTAKKILAIPNSQRRRIRVRPSQEVVASSITRHRRRRAMLSLGIQISFHEQYMKMQIKQKISGKEKPLALTGEFGREREKRCGRK